MLAALLLAAAAVVCAGLAVQYARVFRGGVSDRHASQRANVTLFARAETILALNDADIYAGWRLARVNLVAAVVCFASAAALWLVLRA